MPAQRRDNHLRELEDAVHVTTGAFLYELQLVVVPDRDPCPGRAVSDVLARHHRQLMGRVEDERHVSIPALLDQAPHGARVVRADDHRGDVRWSVVEP